MAKSENRSVSDIEGWVWRDEIPSPETDGGIVTRFYKLHNIPISKLEIHDIRFLIGQNSALEYLVPMALKVLEKDLFLEAEYYSGDLFHALLNINDTPNYWESHRKEKEALIDLFKEQEGMLGTLDLNWEIIVKIKKAYKKFIE